MLIKISQDIGSSKAGSTIEVTDDVGRAYITANLAVEDSQALERELQPAIRDEIRSALADRDKDIVSMFREESARTGRQKFSPVEPTESESDKIDSELGAMANVMRCVMLSHPLNLHSSQEERTQALDLLRNKYCKPKGTRAASESGGGPSGGFLVQPEYYQTLFRLAAEEQVIIPGCFNIPMGTKELIWPALDQYKTPIKGQSSIYGGVQVFRRTESIQRTETDPIYSQLSFVAEDLTGYHEASRDLLADSIISYDALIKEVFGMAFLWRMDWEALNGTGGAQFQGIYNHASTMSVTRNTASTILAVDIFAMEAKMMPMSLPKAVWVTNVTAIPQLAALKDAAGNAIFFSSAMGGIKDAPSEYLRGRRIYYTEKGSALGTSGDLLLVDRSKYAIGTRAGLETSISEHFKFDTDQIAFKFKMRNCGQPLLKGPYISADSANTQLSFAVKLV